MALELKPGDHFRRDMGEEKYHEVVERLFSCGMNENGEFISGGQHQPCFGWSVRSGGLYHGAHGGANLSGRLLTYDDVFAAETGPPPLSARGVAVRAIIKAWDENPVLGAAPALPRGETRARAEVAYDALCPPPPPTPSAPARSSAVLASIEHWDGTGKPQLGQRVKMPGRLESCVLAAGPDASDKVAVWTPSSELELGNYRLLAPTDEGRRAKALRELAAALGDVSLETLSEALEAHGWEAKL